MSDDGVPGVVVDDTGERGIGRVLVIRCEGCDAVLARHQWATTPDAMVMYRAGLDDAAVIKAHAAVHAAACARGHEDDFA